MTSVRFASLFPRARLVRRRLRAPQDVQENRPGVPDRDASVLGLEAPGTSAAVLRGATRTTQYVQGVDHALDGVFARGEAARVGWCAPRDNDVAVGNARQHVAYFRAVSFLGGGANFRRARPGGTFQQRGDPERRLLRRRHARGSFVHKVRECGDVFQAHFASARRRRARWIFIVRSGPSRDAFPVRRGSAKRGEGIEARVGLVRVSSQHFRGGVQRAEVVVARHLRVFLHHEFRVVDAGDVDTGRRRQRRRDADGRPRRQIRSREIPAPGVDVDSPRNDTLGGRVGTRGSTPATSRGSFAPLGRHARAPSASTGAERAKTGGFPTLAEKVGF